MSEMSLSMRAPSVVPRYAVAVGSLKVCRGGTAIGKTPEERGNFNFIVTRTTPMFLTERATLISRVTLTQLFV